MAALEICVENLAGVCAAREGGADRVELCAALSVGGLLPARTLIEAAVDQGLPVHVLIRIEIGGFQVDAAAIEQIAREIQAVRAIGAAGVVVGALSEEDMLDMPALRRWRDAAGPLCVTLHRAIDLARSPVEAVAEAVELGLDRILTSGSARSAPEGARVIAAMVEAAAGRIEIMAGAGITPENAATLLRETGVDALHASASITEDSRQSLVPVFGFGPAHDRRTSIEFVRRLRAITNAED